MTSLPDHRLFGAVMPGPRVAVLMATYNGAGFVDAQLKSLVAQRLRPARVLISDDGSTDATRRIIRQFAARNPSLNIALVSGPGRGAAANFLSLLNRIPDDCDAYAFCDQDDVWLPSKLLIAAQSLARLGRSRPALYCAQSWACKADLSRWRCLRRAQITPAFGNALVQNIAGGHTMVINAAALSLLRRAAPMAAGVAMHDWWMYQIITGAEGRVTYDPVPRVLYRQHAGNMIGANAGIVARYRRARRVWAGQYRGWINAHLDALGQSRSLLSPQNRKTLDQFRAGRAGGIRGRMAALGPNRVHRQGRRGQIALTLALMLGRV